MTMSQVSGQAYQKHSQTSDTEANRRGADIPVGDSVLQVVVNSRAILGRAVLAAEETAVILLVLAPALQALALVLLCHSDRVDKLHICVPATGTEPFVAPTLRP